MSYDKDARKDELLALSSIFDENVITIDEEQALGSFLIEIELPTSFTVSVTIPTQNEAGEKNMEQQSHSLSYLTPLMLRFKLPSSYPSKRQPDFTLTCNWLSLEMLTSVCKKLDEIWDENKGQVILFLWYNFLQNDLLHFLEISNELNLNKAFPQFVHKSTNHYLPRKSNESNGAKNLVYAQKGNYSNNVQKYSDVCSNYPGNSKECNSNAKQFKHKRNYFKNSYQRHFHSHFDRRAFRNSRNIIQSLSSILEYNQLCKEKQFNNSSFLCVVCFIDKLGKQCIRFESCNHIYCKDCVKFYFDVLVKEGNVKNLSCLSDNCNSSALPSQIRELLSPESFAKYDELLLASTLESMGDIIYCPRVSCQGPVVREPDTNLALCPNCNLAFCVHCRMGYHGIERCRLKEEEESRLFAEYQEASAEEKVAMELRYGKKQMQFLVESNLAKEWISKNSKKCPNCSASIEKQSGCNKMTCWRCQTFFCWLCMTVLNRQDPYEHFSSPLARCYGKLLEGVNFNDEEFEIEIDEEDDDDNDGLSDEDEDDDDDDNGEFYRFILGAREVGQVHWLL